MRDVEKQFFRLVDDKQSRRDRSRFQPRIRHWVSRQYSRLRRRVPDPDTGGLRSPAMLQWQNFASPELPCIATPVDILLLNDRLQQIIRVTQRGLQGGGHPPRTQSSFAGLTFYPYRDLLAGPNGATLTLTTSESPIAAAFRFASLAALLSDGADRGALWRRSAS